MGKIAGYRLPRRALIKSAVALGATAAAAGWTTNVFAGSSRTIKLGMVTPRTGPLAPFAEADGFVVDAIGKQFASGIDIGGASFPVEIVVKDSASDPSRAADVAADLILKDKVDLVLVSSTPETTNPVSDQCELERKPCISTVAPWQPWFFGRGGNPDTGFEYTYHFFWGLEDIIATFVSMWNSLSTNKMVAGLFPNDGDGNAWGDEKLGFPPVLAKDGYKITDPGRYQNLSGDFSAQIQAFRDAGAEILTGVPIPPDFTTFWNQALQKGFKPKIASVGKALLFPASVEALGDGGDGLSTEVWWTPNHPYKSTLTGQGCRELADAYETATGKQWTQPIGFAHALFEVASDALKRAEDIDEADALRDAIKATQLSTIVGKVDFSAGPVPNVSKTPLAGGQWRRTDGGKRKYELVLVDNSQAADIPVADKLKPIG